MNLHDIHRKFGTSGLVVSVLLGLLMMLFFGYQLALFNMKQSSLRADAQRETLDAIKNENNALRETLNQRTAALELAKMDIEQTEDVVRALEQEMVGLRNQLGFYQRVMAPEMTQDGFFVDGVAVSPTVEADHFRLQFVLLQQRNNKAVIKGDLLISVTGFLDGEPHTIKAGQGEFLSEGPIVYRFKFFQNVDVGFTLPDNFTPTSLNFATTVYQYTTRRGYYEKTLLWQDILDNSSVSPD